MATEVTVTMSVDAAKRVERALTADLAGHQNRLVDWVRFYDRASTPADADRHLKSAVRSANAAQQVVEDRAMFVRALSAIDEF